MKDGGPAFPGVGTVVPPDFAIDYAGMSLRDWYRGQALAGLCANPEWAAERPKIVAKWANSMADAMLKAREET